MVHGFAECLVEMVPAGSEQVKDYYSFLKWFSMQAKEL